MHNGRRQPSRGGTSRMMREYQVRICERLGVKFPGPTRHDRPIPHVRAISAVPSIATDAPTCRIGSEVPDPDIHHNHTDDLISKCVMRKSFVLEAFLAMSGHNNYGAVSLFTSLYNRAP